MLEEGSQASLGSEVPQSQRVDFGGKKKRQPSQIWRTIRRQKGAVGRWQMVVTRVGVKKAGVIEIEGAGGRLAFEVPHDFWFGCWHLKVESPSI